MKEKSIWLPDILKSNDSMELRYFMQLLLDNFEEYFKAAFHRDVDLNDPQEKREWQELKQAFMKMECPPVWAICLSENVDDLAQWRGYSDDGCGMCIGFDPVYLNAVNDFYVPDVHAFEDDFMLFSKVIYGSQSVNQMLQMVDKAAKDFTYDDEEVFKLFLRNIIHILKNPVFKHESFTCENEWRIIYASNGYPVDFKTILKKQHNNFSRNFSFKELGFQATPTDLISHIELTICDMQRAIKEIWIGPRSNLSIMDVRNFLKHEQLNICIGKDKIIKSLSPYKGKCK